MSISILLGKFRVLIVELGIKIPVKVLLRVQTRQELGTGGHDGGLHFVIRGFLRIPFSVIELDRDRTESFPFESPQDVGDSSGRQGLAHLSLTLLQTGHPAVHGRKDCGVVLEADLGTLLDTLFGTATLVEDTVADDTSDLLPVLFSAGLSPHHSLPLVEACILPSLLSGSSAQLSSRRVHYIFRKE